MMRPGRILLVSSALLLLIGTSGPCHSLKDCQCASSDLISRCILSEFYPYALQDDEYFTLSNYGAEELSLLNWSVSDGEGIVTFATDMRLAAGASLTFSFNGSSFADAYGQPPELDAENPFDQVRFRTSGTFRLANDGDSIELRTGAGEVVDLVVYGECEVPPEGWYGPPLPALRPGEVARRLEGDDGFVDTNRADDWLSFRQHKYGHTRFGRFSRTVPAGGVECFVSPDSALDVLIDTVRTASSSILVCAYEFSSPALCREIVDALGRNVSATVLVEGSPAGGMDDYQVLALSFLAVEGATVLTIGGTVENDITRHIGPLHAKYIVVDGTTSVVLSENLVSSSISMDRISGNRGWGIRMESVELAAFLEAVFESDTRRSRPDVNEWSLDARFDPEAKMSLPEESEECEVLLPAVRLESEASVTLFVSPDCSPETPYLRDIVSSGSDLLVEQFQCDLLWTDRWTGDSILNPLLDAVLEVLGAGGSTRFLLDSSWFTAETNTEVIDYLIDESPVGPPAAEFALSSYDAPVTVIHNKGIILDGQQVLVSSNNWVCSSFSRNRELGVLVKSPEAAAYFTRAFDYDWYPDTTPPVVLASGPAKALLGEVVTFSASGSSDDRGIAKYLWDLHADGTFDARGCWFEFVASQPGRIEIALVGVDSWGNRGSTSVFIDVRPELVPIDPSVPFPWFWLGGSASLGVASGIGFARVLARVRAAGRPRKINQSRVGLASRASDKALLSDRHPGGDKGRERLSR